jgi:hypothetical protein
LNWSHKAAVGSVIAITFLAIIFHCKTSTESIEIARIFAIGKRSALAGRKKPG